MIPSDLASRLRLLIDSETPSLAPIHEIPTDLPDLEEGQRFSAKIQSPLPDGTFRALVAGRTVTLALPSGAKSGDVLELVVTSTQNRIVTARQADAPEVAANTTPQARLSPAGQLISQLLTGRFSTQDAATPLNGSAPLLQTPPSQAGQLLPALRQAVSQSGLFYEAHQAQWVNGDLPLENLLQEPQGQQTSTGMPTAPGDVPEGNETAARHSANGAHAQTLEQGEHEPGLAHRAPRNAREAAELAQREGVRDVSREDVQRGQGNALKIAEPLMPLVHQQLETLATHQALWQGQVWPGQTMQWQIVDPEGQGGGGAYGGDEESDAWQSTLRLQMPSLGGIQAHLIVTRAGVAIRVGADSETSVQALREGSEKLEDALGAAGVALTGFVVQHESVA